MSRSEAAIVAQCNAATGSEYKVLHVYNWVDYIGESTIADFKAKTGTKVVEPEVVAGITTLVQQLNGKPASTPQSNGQSRCCGGARDDSPHRHTPITRRTVAVCK